MIGEVHILNRMSAGSHQRSLSGMLMWLLLVLGTVNVPQRAVADPCGMVPPIYLGPNVPLERIGLQKTYVFYRDGVETFVIRPGFQGKVEEFGMLIPFPNPPALRKVSDDTFAHVAAAIDPPEVVVDLRPMEYEMLSRSAVVDFAAPASGAVDDKLQLNQVAVLNQEAVGMYEVAVLKAGSASALDRWMTDHGFRYPEGMDEVCNDYVADDWCFVAIKARVGQKSGVDPVPGMKETDPALPSGASFDGHVQGMGFRFRSDELVVPMRLSAFNEGDLHNVVYLLTDEPMQIEDMPEHQVVRQVEGADLLRHLMEPLPLRIIGGEYEDIPEARRAMLKQQRDPKPHNGIAKELFAGDLLAADSGELAHAHEELEKELLDIGERLQLRGPDLDKLHHQVVESKIAEATALMLADLATMSMTVIDGDFERKVIAEDNVHFKPFQMDKARNTVRHYNARLFGPSTEGAIGASQSDGNVQALAVSDPMHGQLILQEAPSNSNRSRLLAGAVALLTISTLGLVLLRKHTKTTAAVIVLALAVGVAGGRAMGQEDSARDDTLQENDGRGALVKSLGEIADSPNRSEAISRIAAMGEEAVPELLRAAEEASELSIQGWAIVCLQEIGSPSALLGLRAIVDDQEKPNLVRCWAVAALIAHTDELKAVEPYANLSAQLPAIRRPLRQKILQLLAGEDASGSVESLLRIAQSNPQLQSVVGPALLETAPTTLASILVQSDKTEVRRLAAAWLATQKTSQKEGVNSAVISVLQFDRRAEGVPWGNGPLFVPGVNWNKGEAVALINELTAWFVWCEANEQTEQVQKIVTNLNSWQLMQAAGFQQVPSHATGWLAEWERVIGKEAMDKLMARTGFRFTPARFETAPSDAPGE